MTETAQRPSPSVLGRLSTLRELNQQDLQSLSERLFIHEDRKGAELLALGASEDSTLYLLDGTCHLVAEDGGTKIVRHTDASAQAPMARLRPSRYRVVADTPVRYLRIDGALVEEAVGSLERPSTLALENYEVEEENDHGHLDAENRLTLQIYEDLNSESLMLPSLPNVAVRIGEAVNAEDADSRKIAALIETDPAIALKVVKAANSARYGGASKIATVVEAVTRLGMQDTRFLVVSFALRELFRTNSHQLQTRMFTLWDHSRRVAALTRVLGEKVGGFNVQEALLAGLVHDIGVVAVIGYARDFPEVVENPAALESSVNALRTQLSGMILSKWELPGELVTAAKEAENWYREHPGRADYADLVIVAQLHEGVGGEIDPTRAPALAKLGLAADDIGDGLDLLHAAEDQVVEATRQLACN